MAEASYARLAWVITLLYVFVGLILIINKTPIWQLLYWMVPLGVVVLWFWRFTILGLLDLIRDVVYRDRKLRRLRRQNAEVVGKYRPGASKTAVDQRPEAPFKPAPDHLDELLNAEPKPHLHLGMDWETYRQQRKQRRGE